MYNVGDLVLSKRGRDKGGAFMIVEIIDESYVLIADGSLRKLEKPKRKKIKHLMYLGEANEDFVSEELTNTKLKKMLKCISKA